MLLSSVAHALLGWPTMRTGLQDAGAPADLVGALAAGWYFGSAAMAAFGAVVLVCGMRLRRDDRSGATVVFLIAACYVIFGLAGFFLRHFNPHFLLFIATGALAGLPLLGNQDRGSGGSR